jgi:hypothetical protein
MSEDYTFDPEQPVEEQAARMVASDFDGLARRVKELSGRPYGVTSLTPDQELWAATFEDETVDVPTLLASGMSPAEVVDRRFPNIPALREQAGRTFDEQNKYMTRIVERVMKAREQGRVLKPPPRQEGV